VSLRGRVHNVMPWSLTHPPPRWHVETPAELARRRQVTAATSLAGAGLLAVGLSAEPDSPRFYAATSGVAATWLVGGLAAGPLHLGWTTQRGGALRRPITTPVLTGVAAFGAFYAAAHVARRVPVLEDAIRSVLTYAHSGSTSKVLLTALANGAAEEVFFRGAGYAALGERHPVALSTAGYALATAATRNPALVLAAGVMGALFGTQRRATGGIQAPILTHLTWSSLMLRFLPPLFPPKASL